MIVGFLLCGLSFAYAERDAPGEKNPADTTAQQAGSEETPAIQVKYGGKGWEFSTAGGNYLLQFQSRLQFRYAVPGDSDPLTYDDFNKDEQFILKINRARLKIGGNVFEKWMKYYWEYELAASNLLDFRMMIEKYPYFKVKVGQWKAHFNRERVISSGKQQMVDRSLVNRAFTIDRQQGISLYGNLKSAGFTNFNYWVSVFSGTGRGSSVNDDRHLMYLVRGQWNFSGRELKFEGSDTQYHKESAGLIALAAVTNRSPYTRFSQVGGGQLEGFEPGEPGQYRVNQFLAETALMYRGFAWQQEFHWKEIDDRKNSKITTLVGNYVQLGYFFHHWWNWIPSPLEIAFRHAIYNPDRDVTDNSRQEFSLDFNWFFKGHSNKLTAEVSLFDFQETPEDQTDGLRFRIQWDVSM
jgi:phosphate-selective porin